MNEDLTYAAWALCLLPWTIPVLILYIYMRPRPRHESEATKCARANAGY